MPIRNGIPEVRFSDFRKFSIQKAKGGRLRADARKKSLIKNDMGFCLKGWLTENTGLLSYATIRYLLIGLLDTEKPFSRSARAPMPQEKGLKKPGTDSRVSLRPCKNQYSFEDLTSLICLYSEKHYPAIPVFQPLSLRYLHTDACIAGKFLCRCIQPETCEDILL